MAMYIQHQSNGKQEPPPNHTLEDVAEEMLNGIFCHYEPPDAARLEDEEAKKNKRRSILRAPKVFRRNKKRDSSTEPPKSVRWSDTHDEEEEEKEKEKQKKQQLLSSTSKFPVEISCNLAGTCTDVGIEAGCLSPNTETLIYDDVTTGRRARKKQRDDDGIRQHPSGETEESEGDADEEESDLAVPPPPPPPKPKASTSKKSGAKPSAKKTRSDAPKEELVFDDDGNPVRASGKRGKAPPPPPKPSSKEKYLPQLSGVKINLPEDEAHLQELARSSREGPPSKRYHRPRQEYDYDDLDDFNNSILEERQDDVPKQGKKNKPGNGVTSGMRRRSGSLDETESNVSGISNTSSIFKRMWRRSSSFSKSDNKSVPSQLVDSDQALQSSHGGTGSATPYRHADLDPVELVRSSDEAASTKSRASAFLRVLSPSGKRSVESDWDESIPIVLKPAGKKETAGLPGNTRRSQTREADMLQRRSRSRSADANRSHSPGVTRSRSRSRSLDQTDNRAPLPQQLPQRTIPRPTGQPISYYHPAHPLSRSEADDAAERQSLITAHRAGFDRASTVASSYNSDVLERQSYIMAHRQSHEAPPTALPASSRSKPNAFTIPQLQDDQLERQSLITAHRQGFDPPPHPTEKTFAPLPLPSHLLQQQQQQQQQVYFYQPIPIGAVPPPGYYFPATSVQAVPAMQGAPVNTRGRSASPALRGRSPSPSPHQAAMRKRSQSPIKGRANSPYRRQSFDSQRGNLPVRATPKPSSQGIQAYAPTRTDYQYQQSHLMMQRPGAPRQIPHSYVQAPPPNMISQPPQRLVPTVTASQPRASPVQTVPSAAPIYRQPAIQEASTFSSQYQHPTGDRPSAVILPQTGQAHQGRSIPEVLPKSRRAPTQALPKEEVSASSNQTYHPTYDPLSVHDPNCPPHMMHVVNGGDGTVAAPTVDPVSAYGTQWPPTSEQATPGCSVLGPVFEQPVSDPTSTSVNPSEQPLQVTTTEQQQTEGERASEAKPLPELELSWEERTRQAWERIRSGLITFGEPKETQSAVLSPCSDCGTSDAARASQTADSPPEPVILPENPPSSTGMPVSSDNTMVLPENRSLWQEAPSSAPQLYAPSDGGAHPSTTDRPTGILKQPSYDRRVTFGAPTEQVYEDYVGDGGDDTESRWSHDDNGSRSPGRRRHRVFRGRKLLRGLFHRSTKGGKQGGDKIKSLPHLNTRSTDASSVSGSVTQEWDGGYYYYPHLIEGTMRDPREPPIQQSNQPPVVQQPYNLSCPAPVYYP